MSFSEIIQRNFMNIRRNSGYGCPDVSWWTKCAFHYTDIHNAINILKMGKILSRAEAENKGIMVNDNASYSVISNTSWNVQNYARFYFRPLTPTQYHNEGYKHPVIRFDDYGYANVPIPVFFVFNLEKFLSDPKVEFSPYSQAGHGSQRYTGEEEFRNLPFDKMYSNGFYNYGDEEIKKCRHAELLYPRSYNIDDSLEVIYCRNEFERNMLLLMLSECDTAIYNKYKNYINVDAHQDSLFERNGLFIENMNPPYYNYNKGKYVIRYNFFQNEDEREEYSNKNNNTINNNLWLKAECFVTWKRGNQIIKEERNSKFIKYLESRFIIFDLNKPEGATALYLTIKCGTDSDDYKDIIAYNKIEF